MTFWILAQTQVATPNIVQLFLDAIADNPQLATLAIALIVIYFATSGTKNELRESRKMLNGIQSGMRESQRASDQQEQKALDMATNAINKMDRVADSITDIANAMREGSQNYAEAAQANASAHVTTTNLLVARIAAMDEKRAEDEIYSNEKLLMQVNTQLVQSQENTAALIGNILNEARTMHEETRRAVVDNNEVLMTALLSTPPDVPADKSETQHG